MLELKKLAQQADLFLPLCHDMNSDDFDTIPYTEVFAHMIFEELTGDEYFHNHNHDVFVECCDIWNQLSDDYEAGVLQTKPALTQADVDKAVAAIKAKLTELGY
jgi:hypothetical protein